MSILVSFGVALLLVPLARVAGARLGVVDRPSSDGLKIHASPISLLGGAAALIAAAITLAVTGDSPQGWVVVGVLLALIVGSIDDVRPLPPGPRLLALLVAGVAVAVGVGDLDPIGSVIVAVAVAACANAVNLLDGQDGLAGGLVVVAALGLGAAFVLWDRSSSSVAFALAGGVAGFVAWNMSPARIFLGNGGAYAAGAALAALAGIALRDEGTRGLIVAVLCVWPFAFELLATVIRRAASGSMTRGDRAHSYDVMAARGILRRTITFWAWGLGACCSGLGLVAAASSVGVGAAIVPMLAAASVLAARALWWSPRRVSVDGG